MMEIGNGALTVKYAHLYYLQRCASNNCQNSEQRTHFAMWAALKSPILLGTDVRANVRCLCSSSLT